MIGSNLHRSLSRRGAVPVGGLVAGLLVLSIAFIGAFYFVHKRVGPDEVGVKRIEIGPGAGIVQKAYGPGRYFIIPWYQRFLAFDATVQKLELTGRPPDRAGHWAEQVRFKTADGNDIYVDASVLFRIDVQRPFLIWQNFGDAPYEYVERRVKPLARSDIRTVLGELTTEEFYNSPIRQAKLDECRRRMSVALEESGLQLVDLLIRDYQFTSDIEAAIRKRKLADQLKLVNESKASSAEEKASIDQIVANGEANARVERTRGETDAQKLYAEADLYRRQKEAESELALKTAEAEGKRLLNQALSGAGGENIVGLEMAEALDGIELIVLPAGAGGVNPLNLKEMLRMVDVNEKP